MQQIDGALSVDQASEPRLSPFSTEARHIINGIYADLARHADFDGILFHDDGRLNQYEDWSPAALAAYREHLGRDITLEKIQSDPELAQDWNAFRSDVLIDLSDEIKATVQHYRPDIRTARNLFATAVLEPESELHLAQSFDSFLEAYDYVAIMAMPRFEGYGNHRSFYQRLATLSAESKGGLDRVIFELQTVDWRTSKPIDSLEIRDTMRSLQSLGVRNLAYYPDDFIQGHPDLDALRQGMSIATYPVDMPR
jgi:biofilm PGA synthesis lipoprotein PgaB